MIIAYKFNPYLFLNVYIINKRMSDLYIDEIYCVAANTQSTGETTPTPFTDGETFLHGNYGNVSSITTDGTTDHQKDGYKWIVEIFNRSGSPQNYGGYQLRVCTNYYDTNELEVEDYDFDYTFPTGDEDLPNDQSIYVGWELTVDGSTITPLNCTTNISNDNGQQILLADQEDGDGKYYITTRFILYDPSGSPIDICGDKTINSDNKFNFSPVLKGAFGEDLSDNRRTPNSFVRSSYSSRPRTIFSTGDWYTTTFASQEQSRHQFGAVGDPHICTLFGENYEFDHLGPIRLFDNEHIRNGDENDLIVINGLVESGPGRWAKKQYIQKLFIYNAGKTMLVNLGFRGSKVIVESNDGIKYEEEELGFSKDALMYSFDDHARFSDPEDAKEYAELNNVHIPPLVRNKIKFELCGCEEDTKAHKVELAVCLENVNEYNLQPCRLSLDVGNDFNKELATGCLVNRKYATHCDLKSLEDISDLPEPTEEELKNMPELEIAPKLINKKYV